MAFHLECRTIKGSSMKAGNVMTTKLISVSPDMPGRAVAQVLFKNGISAVPVVDDQGAPIGMVSEGDLMPRNEAEREARRDWWLQMLSEGQYVNNPEFDNYLKGQDRTARDIMIKPVLTVSEDAELTEVADLLSRNKIKRVPVVRDGRMVGIVSRADLVRAFAQPQEAERLPDRSGEMPVASAELEALSRKTKSQPASRPEPSSPFSATGFRGLVAHFKEEEATKRKQARQFAEEEHHKQARQLLAAHLTEETWKHALANARTAAANGAEEFLLLRFPSELCTDRGRAINAPDHDWPETLRGMAADIYMRWRSELRPQGFDIHARVVDFRDGVPGDIGLFLSWGRMDAAKAS